MIRLHCSINTNVAASMRGSRVSIRLIIASNITAGGANTRHQGTGSSTMRNTLAP
ncbi:hypothetical protein D3C71_2110170 [compost metagenome]